MNKGIWAISIAAAFAVGMMVQAIPADASHSRDNDAHGGLVGFLQEQVETIQTEILSLQLVSHEPLNVSCPPGQSIRVVNTDGSIECLVDDDNDPTNEIQDLSFDPDTRFLSISEGNSVFIPEIDDEVLVGFAKLDEDNRFIGANEFPGVSFTPGAVTFRGEPVDFSGTEASFLSICIDGDCRTEWPADSAFPNTYTRTGLPAFCDPNDKVLGGGPVNSHPEIFVQNSGPTGIGSVLEGWQSNGIQIILVPDADGGLNVGAFVRIPIPSTVVCADLTP